jgi:hypothetical protein
MWGRKPKCPVRVEEQLWIEESLDWFVDEFGEEVLRRPVVVPEWSYFPAGYSGSEDDVRAVFASVCARGPLSQPSRTSSVTSVCSASPGSTRPGATVSR